MGSLGFRLHLALSRCPRLSCLGSCQRRRGEGSGFLLLAWQHGPPSCSVEVVQEQRGTLLLSTEVLAEACWGFELTPNLAVMRRPHLCSWVSIAKWESQTFPHLDEMWGRTRAEECIKTTTTKPHRIGKFSKVIGYRINI